MKQLRLNVIFMLLFVLSARAQTDSTVSTVHPDLQDLKDRYTAYFDSNGVIIDSNQIKHARKIARSINFWERRASSGFAGYGQNMLAFWEDNAYCQNHDGLPNTEENKWQNIHIQSSPTDKAFPFPSYAGGSGAIMSHWVKSNGNNAPLEMYVGASTGGLWKTTDGGASWNNITDNGDLPNQGIGAISVNPSNTDEILISMRVERHANHLNIGVFRTTNGGGSWTHITSLYTPDDEFGIMDIKRNPSNPDDVWAISHDRVYHSTDGGGTFFEIQTLLGAADCPPNLKRIFINPYNTSQIFVMGKRLYRYNGTYFSDITNNIGISDCKDFVTISMDVSEDTPNRLVISVNTSDIDPITNVPLSSGNTIYASTTNGFSWTQLGQFTGLSNFVFGTGINSFVTIYSDLAYFGSVRIFELDLSNYGYTFPGSWLSSDYGTSFYHDDIRSLSKLKVNNSWHLYAGTDGGFYKSTDLGATWTHLNANVDVSEIFDFSTHSKTDHIISGTQDMGATTYNKKDETWHPGVLKGDYTQNIFNLTDDPICFTKEYFGSKISRIKDRDLIDVHNQFFGTSGPVMLGAHGASNYTGQSINYKTKTNVYVAHSKVVDYNLETDTYTDIANYPDLSGDPDWEPNCIAIANANSNPDVLYLGWGMAGGWHDTPNLFRGERDASGQWTWQNISTYQTSPYPGPGYWVLPRAICVHPEDENTVMVGMDANTLTANGNPRVMYTTNGGQTWEDKSYGLPTKFGVNDLVFQKGSDNRYYAATDVGIYYYDPYYQENGNVGKWRCFNYGLPNTLVSDLEIDYCRSTLYAATFGRGMWEAPLITTNLVDLVVSSDQTWDYYKEVGGDIRVTNGAVLTVTGDLIMQSNARIHVEVGAELRVEGGRITSACDDAPWYGILAEGTSTQHQSPAGHPTYQSLIYLDNATIENAKNAITTAKMDPNFNIMWGHSGAVIKATNTHFKNNRRSIAYMSYQNFNPSNGNPRRNYGNFTDCQFTTDEDYTANSPYDHNIQVTAWEVRGIVFRGCEFSMPFNTSGTAGSIESKAIFALDAGLEIKSKCTSPPYQFPCNQFKHSTFEGYDVAIDIDNTSSAYPIEIDRADFLNNYHAISLNNADFSRITRCDINNTINYQGYTGINLYHMKGFSVEENHIKTESGSINGIRAQSLFTVGDFVKDEIIYKNKIASARHGIEIQGATGTGQWGYIAGLTAECNDFGANVEGFDDNNHDIRIGASATSKTIWGSNSDPMENFFSLSNTNTERHLKSLTTSGNNLHTYIWNTDELLTDPFDRSSHIGTQDFQNGTRACPSLLSDFYNKPPDLLRLEYKALRSSFNTVYDNYNNIINGGITQQLLDELWDISNDNNDALIQNLIDNSPYLSDEIMIEAIHYPHISDWDLTQILVWNGPLTPRVQNEASQSGRFTATYLNMILDRTGVSQRFLLDQQLAQKVKDFSLAENHYYQRVLLDSNMTIFDTNDVFIDSMDLTNRSYEGQLALDWYMATNQYGKASSLLDNDSIIFPEDSVSHYKDFKRLAIGVFSGGDNWFTMEQRQIDSLILLGNDSSKADFQLAQNVLEFLDIQRFAEPMSSPDVVVRQMQPIIKPDSEVIGNQFKVWPNPVSDQLKIVWQDHHSQDDLIIELTDMLGKQVYTSRVNMENGMCSIDCSSYTSGTYILSIQHQTGVYQEKVEITH